MPSKVFLYFAILNIGDVSHCEGKTEFQKVKPQNFPTPPPCLRKLLEDVSTPTRDKSKKDGAVGCKEQEPNPWERLTVQVEEIPGPGVQRHKRRVTRPGRL